MRRQLPNAEEARTQEEVYRLLSSRTVDALTVLVSLMQDEGQKPELRMKAAESILDRALGKGRSATSCLEDGASRSVCFEGVLEEWSQ